MIDVISLKWGDKFSPEYVNNLYQGVCRHSTIPFRFHCFTDDVSGIQPDIITHNLPDLNIVGWWFKIWLFSDDLPFNQGDRILFLDLDTIVTGNIDYILDHQCPRNLTGLKNFYRPDRFASGMLMWRYGSQTHIWTEFAQNPARAQQLSPDGDQQWTERQALAYDRWQDVYPDAGIYSYKQSCSRALPDNATIVCYHGTPSIVQSFTETVKNYDGVWPPADWPEQYWRGQ